MTPKIYITETVVSSLEGHTYVSVSGETSNFADHFPTRKDGKEWAMDILVAYFEFRLEDAVVLVNDVACDCEGPTHSRHCWWCVEHDDGREQDT